MRAAMLRRAHICSALLLGCLLGNGSAYNIDVTEPRVFRGLNGTLFGYSVLLHSYADETWLVAGAPRSNWIANQSVANPGAILKCRIGKNPNGTCEQLQLGNPLGERCGKTCVEERDDQWMGVSLSRQAEEGGQLVACGHRWKNVYYLAKEHKQPQGICYIIKPNFQMELSKRLSPCYKNHDHKFGEKLGSCQAGTSSFYTRDLIIMGAPGSYYWTGSIFAYNTTNNVSKFYIDADNRVKFGSYLGYSVGAGHFQNPVDYDIIGGAPQYEQIGSAYIFSIGKVDLNILFEAQGKKLGSYFGAAVCAVDLNADGLSDLLVGAPMQSTVREEGRVFVYINKGSGTMQEMNIELRGSDAYSARFGETIANLGDIDSDGFEDVAIAAPQEEDLQGAIYIYNGREAGITPTFSQRIQGRSISNSIRMFGQSISGGIDADGNGYPDVAVGAFLSDSAVLLRTRAVVVVEASLNLSSTVNRTRLECTENGRPAVCLDVSICFSFKGRGIPGYIVLNYNLSMDVDRVQGTLSRFYFSTNGTSDVIMGKMNIHNSKRTCRKFQAFMRRDVRDILTPIYVEETHQPGDHIVKRRSSEEFSPLKSILQQNDRNTHMTRKKVVFARFCGSENCSADLEVSGKIAFPTPFEEKPYLAIGSMKTLMLNISVSNHGDDAFQSVLHIQLPKGLYFIKVRELNDKQIHCKVSKVETQLERLDCSIGNVFVDSQSKMDFSFLLDASSFTRAEDDLIITVAGTCENEENKELLRNNFANFTVPLRYEAQLKIYGSVTPSSFSYGPSQADALTQCHTEEINFLFHVVNTGLSLVPDVALEIMAPNAFASSRIKLFNVLDVKTSAGECVFNNYTRDCTLTEGNFYSWLEDLIMFFAKKNQTSMYCMKEDPWCLQILCKLGDIEPQKETNIEVVLEMRPSLSQMDEVSSLQLETRATVLENNPRVVHLQKEPTNVLLEGLHNQKRKARVTMMIILISILLGITLLMLLTYFLLKIGFFKRMYEPLPTEGTHTEEKDGAEETTLKTERNGFS
ncbi:integrin alpha-4 [Ambystoma mexicanum]|uniref:integrin alpha-4 n=1 Tax=Ambystoma mexicanum TaxID=8296 RepID=UPI0037E990AC